MSNRLGGKQGTAYLGTNANQPVNITFNNRPPTQYDTQNVSLGDEWFDDSAQGIARFWKLASLAGNMTSKGSLADWVQFDTGAALSLTTNSGGSVHPTAGNINVLGDVVTIVGVGNPGTSTITLSTGSHVATQYPCDVGTGSPVAGSMSIVTFGLCGSSVITDGAVGSVSLQVTDINSNTLIGNGCGNSSVSGSNNVGLGHFALNLLTSGITNTGIGPQALEQVTTGSDNTGIGFKAGFNYTSSESSNIVIANPGVAAESNTIRIGVNGSSSGQQNACYVGGIYAASFDATTEQLVMVDVNNKLGSTNLAALSWTPTLTFGGSSTGITYSVQEGIYQSIGNLVFYAGGFVLSSKGSATGTARVTGLPFTASGVFNVQFGQLAVSNITFPMGQTYAWNLNDVGTNNLLLSVGGSGTLQVLLNDTNFSNSSALSVTGYYFRN